MSGWAYVAQYGGAACIGAGVGIAELVSRYRDQPAAALRSPPAAGYILINAAASAAALGLIFTFGWKFGASGGGVVATRILMAGFGAMALFRSSLFTVRAGERDVGIGPATILSIILAACDAGVDRTRAESRAGMASEVMRGVSFSKAQGPLPTVALALMQNLPPPDQAALGVQLQKLRDDREMSDSAKSLLLGLALANAVGPDVLREAKTALGQEILLEAGERAVRNETQRKPSHAPQIPGTDAQGRATGEMPQTPQTP
jgi:hypothetical protein